MERPRLAVTESSMMGEAVKLGAKPRVSRRGMLPHVACGTGCAGSGSRELCNSTTAFLVGNIEPPMEWYKRPGFESKYYPPGFASLSRDGIEIFLQQRRGASRHTIREGASATRGTCASSLMM
jgi:hypothetical protein